MARRPNVPHLPKLSRCHLDQGRSTAAKERSVVLGGPKLTEARASVLSV
jgi:hypothetical protein